MAWKDRLRPASFRGIPFFIEVSQYTSGRRVTFHEFPDRDLPFAEDLGRVGRTFRVEGHILGDDYFEQKERIIEAAEKEGPGELIHPYFGTRFVQCGAFSIDEDTKEGRFAKITFQFFEAGDNRFPKSVEDKQQVLADKVDLAKAAAKGEFDNNFSILGLSGFAVESAQAAVEKAADAFQDATKGLQSTIEGIADLAFNIRNLKADTLTLLQSPGRLSDRLLDSLRLLENALELPEGKLQSKKSLFLFAPNPVVKAVLTPTRQKEQDNLDLLQNFIRRVAIVDAINVAPTVEFASVDEATTERNELRDAIDEQLLTTDDDDVFQTLKDVNAQLVSVLPDVDADLPNVQTITIESTTPALLVAYDQFQNPDAEQDIINRNNIRHPGFILGGTELEVIDVRQSS